MEEKDLWPSFDDVPSIRSPKMVLIEQANFLSEKTKNILNANVRSFTTADQQIGYEFNIVAPMLKNYSYKLFSLYHDIFYYPSRLFVDGKLIVRVEDENHLIESLATLFSSDNTKRVITSLLAQSKDVDQLS